MEVGHRLETLLAAQVRVDGVALDRARPDDRHLHDEVVEAGRPALRERLHLGPALDLEDPDGVGRLEHREDLGDLLGQPVEVEAGRAVALDELERLVDRGQHPEAEQVELDQLERLDVALVVLDDDPVLHRRPLERGDVDERGGGDEHPAAVDAEVTREAVHPGAQLEPALPVREPDDAPAAWLGRRLRLDPGDAGMRCASRASAASRRRVSVPAARPSPVARRSGRGAGRAGVPVERPPERSVPAPAAGARPTPGRSSGRRSCRAARRSVRGRPAPGPKADPARRRAAGWPMTRHRAPPRPDVGRVARASAGRGARPRWPAVAGTALVVPGPPARIDGFEPAAVGQVPELAVRLGSSTPDRAASSAR